MILIMLMVLDIIYKYSNFTLNTRLSLCNQAIDARVSWQRQALHEITQAILPHHARVA